MGAGTTSAKVVAATAARKAAEKRLAGAAKNLTQATKGHRTAQESLAVASGRLAAGKEGVNIAGERVAGFSKTLKATTTAAKATSEAIADGALASAEKANRSWALAKEAAYEELRAAEASVAAAKQAQQAAYGRSMTANTPGYTSQSLGVDLNTIAHQTRAALGKNFSTAKILADRARTVAKYVAKASDAQEAATATLKEAQQAAADVVARKAELAAAQEAAANSQKIAELTHRLEDAQRLSTTAPKEYTDGLAERLAGEAVDLSSLASIAARELQARAEENVAKLSAKLAQAEKAAAEASQKAVDAQAVVQEATLDVKRAEAELRVAELEALRAAQKLGGGGSSGVSFEEEASPSLLDAVWEDIKEGPDAAAATADLDGLSVGGGSLLLYTAATDGRELLGEAVDDVTETTDDVAARNEKKVKQWDKRLDDHEINTSLSNGNMNGVWAAAENGKPPAPKPETENFTPIDYDPNTERAFTDFEGRAQRKAENMSRGIDNDEINDGLTKRNLDGIWKAAENPGQNPNEKQTPTVAR